MKITKAQPGTVPATPANDQGLRGLDRVSAVGRLAAGGFRSLEEWGHVEPRDHLADEHRRGQQRSIDRCGSPSSKPMGVALHTRSQPVGSGDPARTRTWPLPAHASARGTHPRIVSV